MKSSKYKHGYPGKTNMKLAQELLNLKEASKYDSWGNYTVKYTSPKAGEREDVYYGPGDAKEMQAHLRGQSDRHLHDCFVHSVKKYTGPIEPSRDEKSGRSYVESHQHHKKHKAHNHKVEGDKLWHVVHPVLGFGAYYAPSSEEALEFHGANDGQGEAHEVEDNDADDAPSAGTMSAAAPTSGDAGGAPAAEAVIQQVNKMIEEGATSEEVRAVLEGKESLTSKIAHKIMGKAPKNAYKVGADVEYEMHPAQEGGRGKGKITKVLSDGEHYLINGKPVSYFEIKKVVKEASHLNDDTIDDMKDRETAEKKFSSYKSWKAACKKVDANVWYDGDEDISQAMVGDKPYKRGKTKSIGEWDGAEGVVFQQLTETEHLSKLATTIGGKDEKTADQLEVGDMVEIANGNTKYDGAVGEIERFGQDKKFVVVKLYGGKGSHSFHSSDVLSAKDDSDQEDEDDEDTNEDTFYVAFYEEDEERSWIGIVTRAGGGKWHEKSFKGKPDYRWGQSYMSYLTPSDVMSWIYKDYSRGVEIEGPFFDGKEAIEHVKHNWGKIEEGLSTLDVLGDRNVKMTKVKEEAYTDINDWKAAVKASHPTKAAKMKFNGRMEGGKTTISAEVPGEDRCYGVWDAKDESGTVLKEAPRYGDAFKRREMEYELRDEDPAYYNRQAAKGGAFGLRIDGKQWMKNGAPVKFNSMAAAQKAASSPRLSTKKVEVVALSEEQSWPEKWNAKKKDSAPAGRGVDVVYGVTIDGKLWTRAGQPVSFTTSDAAKKAAAAPILKSRKTEVVKIKLS
jgi:hypothetical protein